MIISKENKLTVKQLHKVESIVGEFDCSIQVIYGAHRNIYAIIGDERSELMVNRIEGLTYIDRVDRMESVYKLMDVRSELAGHRSSLGGVKVGEEPLIIAGHCTIDPKNPGYLYETAAAIKEAGAHALRGGVWKPRTTPHSYQGDTKTLDTLLEAKARTGLPVVTEVMDEEQIGIALEANIDMIQIGTRNALNYSLLKQVGKRTAGTGTAVLLKRGRHMGPIDEYIAAGEYIVSKGNPNLFFCPRGTLPGLDGYRNHPDESITPLLKQKTWAPVIVDPSHSVGRSMYVPACCLASMAYGADGLIIETHIDPARGIGDDPVQSVTPEILQRIIKDARTIWNLSSRYTGSS